MAVMYTPESPDNKSIRELRDELTYLNKSFKKAVDSNEKISTVLVAFALVQIAIAMMQAFITVKEAEGYPQGVGALLVLGALAIYVIKMFMDKK